MPNESYFIVYVLCVPMRASEKEKIESEYGNKTKKKNAAAKQELWKKKTNSLARISNSFTNSIQLLNIDTRLTQTTTIPKTFINITADANLQKRKFGLMSFSDERIVEEIRTFFNCINISSIANQHKQIKK